jgi:hypothetical protein
MHKLLLIANHRGNFMHLYAELWKAWPKWLALAVGERKQYFDNVGTEIQKLTDAGVEVVGFAINDEDTPNRGDYRYLAVWKMPSLEQSGWYEYFEQVNARGELIPPPDALGDMARLSLDRLNFGERRTSCMMTCR